MRTMILRRQGAPLELADANQALDDLRAGRFDGAAVIVVNPEGTG